MNKWRTFSLYLPLFCLMVWTLFLSVITATGVEVKLRIKGFDPRDILAGHYISYQIDWENSDLTAFAKSGCRAKFNCTSRSPCRFYVPADRAQQLDSLLRTSSNNQDVFEIIFSCTKNVLYAQTLLLNGKDYRLNSYPKP